MFNNSSLSVVYGSSLTLEQHEELRLIETNYFNSDLSKVYVSFSAHNLFKIMSCDIRKKLLSLYK